MKEKINTKEVVSTYEGLKSIEQLASEGEKVKITENQLKVMANKYLRGDSVELWLRRIARNIALASLFYEEGLSREQILDGVKHQLVYSEAPKTEMLLLQIKNLPRHERIANFRKFEDNLVNVAQTNQKATKVLRELEEKFYNMLASFDFLPNSPCLMNAGRDLQGLQPRFL